MDMVSEGRPMKRGAIPQHDGSGLERCSPTCKGCRAEQEQIDHMIIPPPRPHPPTKRSQATRWERDEPL